MADVLACIDASAYARSVCDHGAWFASDPEVGVEVLHVSSSAADEADVGRALVDYAVWRLREEGVGPVSSALVTGSFVEVASTWEAELIVMGKRGASSDSERGRLGSSIDPMIRTTTKPVCLTSRLFLPIHRALILQGADMEHRIAIEFVAAHPRLAGLPADVVVMAGPGEDPAPKVEWTRRMLKGDVFAFEADGLDAAVAQYMESRTADLVVVSRSVLLPDAASQLMRIEERGLWGTRTSVLIC